MRYAGGNDSSRPWNDVTNPLRLQRSEPWRMYPDRNFSGGTMEGLVSNTSQVSDYLDSSDYIKETQFLHNRGFNGGHSQKQSWEEMYGSDEEPLDEY